MEELNARGIACVYGTVRAIVSGKQDGRAGRATSQRFAPANVLDKVARLPAIDSPAMRGMRTLYPHTVVAAGAADVLKSGHNSPKIGAVVLKGRWRGMPIYTLTLEERATCPVSCRHLRSCFGNKLNWAIRYDHTHPGFERLLVKNIVRLQAKHPLGFVVRLHVLGDFFSVRYVRLWESLIETQSAMRVFGYTARWEDEIGAELRRVVRKHWNRFAVRFSNAPTLGLPTTLSIELPIQCPPDTIICPEQMRQTESCSSCGLCWHSRRRIAFIQH